MARTGCGRARAPVAARASTVRDPAPRRHVIHAREVIQARRHVIHARPRSIQALAGGWSGLAAARGPASRRRVIPPPRPGACPNPVPGQMISNGLPWDKPSRNRA